MVSVIIPALNEAARLPATLDSIRHQEIAAELLVIDGGSQDATAEIAEKHGVRVLACEHRQRAAQMNFGARASSGTVLLFLHADTRLAAEALRALESSLADPAVIGGGFARRYDSPSLFLAITCRLAEWRTRWNGWFLGDQAIFARRTAFESLGGFRGYEIFEDLDFSQRLSQLGRVVTLRPPVLSDGRRFTQRGAWRTTWSDFGLTWRYLRARRSQKAISSSPTPLRSPATS